MATKRRTPRRLDALEGHVGLKTCVTHFRKSMRVMCFSSSSLGRAAVGPSLFVDSNRRSLVLDPHLDQHPDPSDMKTREKDEHPHRIHVTRKSAERCNCPEGGGWETPAKEAQKDKDRRRNTAREAATQGETQSEEAAQLRGGAEEWKWQHASGHAGSYGREIIEGQRAHVWSPTQTSHEGASSGGHEFRSDDDQSNAEERWSKHDHRAHGGEKAQTRKMGTGRFLDSGTHTSLWSLRPRVEQAACGHSYGLQGPSPAMWQVSGSVEC